MREQAAKATDPQLKATLAEMGAEVAGLKPDVTSIDGSRLDQLQQRIDQLCGD